MLTRWAASSSSTRAPDRGRTPTNSVARPSGSASKRASWRRENIPVRLPARHLRARSVAPAGTARWPRSPRWRSSEDGRSSSSRSGRATTSCATWGSTATTRSGRCGPSAGAKFGSTSARVNGRLFLNNVSLGLYARLVHEQDGGDTLAQTESARAPRAESERPWRDRRRSKRPRSRRRRLEQPVQPRRLLPRRAGAARRGRTPPVRRARVAAQNLGGASRHRVHGRRPSGIGCALRSTASRNSSRRRCASRSSRPRYECFCPSTASTSRVCGNARSSSEISAGVNQRSSATSSCGSGTPSTMRAVQ